MALFKKTSEHGWDFPSDAPQTRAALTQAGIEGNFIGFGSQHFLQQVSLRFETAAMGVPLV